MKYTLKITYVEEFDADFSSLREAKHYFNKYLETNGIFGSIHKIDDDGTVDLVEHFDWR